MKKCFPILLILLLNNVQSALSKVKLLPIFSSNMVMQQRTDAPIWGEANPNKKISIVTSWNQKRYVSKADAKGHWQVKVSTPAAGGPYEIKISDGKPITLNNVMIGEVWLCTGQSNMEMPIEGWNLNNYKQEIVDAQDYPNIRFLKIKKRTSPRPKTEVEVDGNGWLVCSSNTVRSFSATGYFFGRNIERYQNVPVGLIETCWAGTCAQPWVSSEALKTMPTYTKSVEEVRNMPDDVEKQIDAYEDNLKKWIKNSMSLDKGYVNGEAVWSKGKTDDSQWDEIVVPHFIQTQKVSLNNVNGIF